MLYRRHMLWYVLLVVVILALLFVFWKEEDELGVSANRQYQISGCSSRKLQSADINNICKDKPQKETSDQESFLRCILEARNRNVSESIRTSRFSHTRKEFSHIGFLKVHKAASTTVQNILFRFAHARNLSLVLTQRGGHILSTSTKRMSPVLSPLRGEKHDILTNHATFNYQIFSSILHNDTLYIGIVRDPLEQFISAAYYYRYKIKTPYLAKIVGDDFLKKLIRDPTKYEVSTLEKSRTYNPMTNDFGLVMQGINNTNPSNMTNHLLHLDNIFSLVIVVEYFDESLILLKRYLNWKFQDILYIKRNAFNAASPNLSDEDIAIFRKRNAFDYTLYDFFYERFWKQIRCEGPDFFDEVKHFRRILQDVIYFCLTQINSKILFINSSPWNEQFVVKRSDCSLMMKEEMTLNKMLYNKHLKMLKEQNRTITMGKRKIKIL